MSLPTVNTLYAGQAASYQPEGPRPLMREISSGIAYPIDALGPLAEVVRAVHDITQAPIAIAAQSALAVASLAVQGFGDVETLGGHAPCSLYCLTIAESGERKSTCDSLLMQPIKAYERELASAHRTERETYRLRYDVWTLKRKKLMEAATAIDPTKAADAAKKLITLGPEPLAPLLPNLTAQDPTFEGLLKLYAMGRPALGLFSDEGGGFIGGHAMNTENRLKTLAGLSQLWNGETVNRIRAGDGISDYPARRLSLHLMAQPIAALPLLADPQATGQGFLARFLISQPPSAIGTRLRLGHSEASDTALTQYQAYMLRLLATPLPTPEHRQELAPQRLQLSKGARELLGAFACTVELAQTNDGDMAHIRSYASKAAEQAARIAGVLTLYEDLQANEIAGDTMAKAITLAEYYLTEAKRLAEAGLVSAATAKAERLREWLTTWQHDEITPSEILQFGPNALRERIALDPPLAMLMRAGHLIALEAGSIVRGKPRVEAYRIVAKG